MAKTKEIQKRDKTDVQSVERTRSGKVFIPDVDIIDAEDHLTLLADMPGADNKSIDITLENRLLTIQANVSTSVPEGFKPAYQEYEVGDFRRSFTLDDTIDREKIKADFKNGVLKLTLPKAEAVKPRKIEVRTV